MVNNREFHISGSIFGEYKTVINLDLVDSVDDILEIVINRIEEDMKNYPQILKKLDKEKEKFHIHGYEFGSILISEIDVIFYVCSHC
jgi:hypothetical protein|tara:strand:+ start:179 stop:439 length:261 start_codon:yes stop_codon:yes gene_type:complete